MHSDPPMHSDPHCIYYQILSVLYVFNHDDNNGDGGVNDNDKNDKNDKTARTARTVR